MDVPAPSVIGHPGTGLYQPHDDPFNGAASIFGTVKIFV
jgi:hypothetical protein